MYKYPVPGNRYVELEKPATSVKDWLQEANDRFGPDVNDWTFKCPICGREYTVREFVAAGGKDASAAYQECIGQYFGAGPYRAENGNKNGCHWIADDFLGCAGKGRWVIAADGMALEVFPFADAEDGANGKTN